MPNKYITVKFEEAQNLLEEGDVLLFRGQGIISTLIKLAGVGEYSHVAIASKTDDNLWEAVEFREWYGGRSINLQNYIEESLKKNTYIDVYRSIDTYAHLVYDELTSKVTQHKIKFNGRKITRCMRKLTGLPYSYKRIFLILKIKLFKLHLLRNLDKIVNELPTDELVYPVCSTVVAHCFATNFFYILRNKSDAWMEPSDFARSPRLNYLFTLLN